MKVGLERRCMVLWEDVEGREVGEEEVEEAEEVERCDIERTFEAVAGVSSEAARTRGVRIRLREQSTTPRRMLSGTECRSKEPCRVSQ